MITLPLVIFAVAAFAAGIINSLAGGGAFITFPALLLTGLDPRAANMTSTIALFPMQISTGYAGRKMAGGTSRLSFRTLFLISLIGGALGGLLLIVTPSDLFARLVPWLILFATVIFAYGTFRKKKTEADEGHAIGAKASVVFQFLISVYGGYFGGGIGFLMLAAFTLAGMAIRKAGATKNILTGVMNAAAVVIFAFSKDIGWLQVGIGAICSIAGGLIGVKLLHRVNEQLLRIAIIVFGLALTAAMFIKAPR